MTLAMRVYWTNAKVSGRNSLTDDVVAESLRDSEFGVSERRRYGKSVLPARQEVSTHSV
jgi:hypothetical protein